MSIFIIIQDNKSTDHTRDPTKTGEDEYDEKRSAALVNNGQRGEDDSKKNSKQRHQT